MEKAWDRCKGKSFVRVGIYDTGIAYHPDLPVAENYFYTTAGNNFNDDYHHGTFVAGVIGAKTNDTLGVAGIAGGDGLNTGVSIINMKVSTGSVIPSTALHIAYQQGASGFNIPQGKALHVTNHSYGINLYTDSALVKGINYMNANGVAFVAARGNKYANSNYSLSNPSAPATMKPNKVMNVGGSGTDGHHHILGVNGTNYTSLDSLDVDFVAPGDSALVYTTSPQISNVPPAFFADYTPLGDYLYHGFSGTSMSSPHVAGVTALMMSYRNHSTAHWDNLVHEDCEAILKRTATDLSLTPVYNEDVDYDYVTGEGRINADSALQAIGPEYRIRHIDKSHFSTSVYTSTSVVASSVTLGWASAGQNMPAAGLYVVDIIKVQTDYAYNYSTEQFLKAWELYAPSIGYVNFNGGIIDQSEPAFVQLISASTTGASLRTYVYQLKQNVQTGATLSNVFVPTHPNNVNSAFTLYTLGGDDTGVKQIPPQVDYFNVYPNPSNGHLTIAFSSKAQTKGELTITDLMGRTVYQKDQFIAAGLNRNSLALGLPGGIYFLSLKVDDNKVLVKKLIIE